MIPTETFPMSFKTILAHVDDGPRAADVMDFAADLARGFGAHLVVLHATRAAVMPSAVRVEGGSALADIAARLRDEQRAAAQALFARRLGAAGIPVELRLSARDPDDALPLHARYADLVVMTQPDPDGSRGAADLAGHAVVACGKPVLFVPYAGAHRVAGGPVLVSWDASREAARAVSDALPLLVRARAVEVVTFDPTRSVAGHGELPGADIALWLARHGVKVNVDEVATAGVDVGNSLLSKAADLGAELVVMGGYGHSRLREFVFGGVTRTMLETMTVPVLMAH